MQRTIFAGAALIAAMTSVNAVQIQVEANLPQDDDSMYAQLNADEISKSCQRAMKFGGKENLTGKCKREVAREEARPAREAAAKKAAAAAKATAAAAEAAKPAPVKKVDPMANSTRAEKAFHRWSDSSRAAM